MEMSGQLDPPVGLPLW